MRSTMWIVAIVAAMSAPWLATAQERPTPTPEAPRAAEPAPTARPAAPSDPSEIGEIEIIEAPEVRSTQDGPAPPDAVEPPVGRREVRIVDGDMTIWVDEEGHMMELGDVMGQALEYNPELRAIRAEIQALMARLEQLEMKTATDVARKKVELKGLVDKQGKLKQMKVDSPEVLALDADIAAKKIELDYIVGVRGDRPLGDRMRVIRMSDDALPAIAPLAPRLGGGRPGLETVPENIRTSLDQRVSLEFHDKQLSEVMEFITEMYALNISIEITIRSMPTTVMLKDVTLRDALTAIADANALAFIVRDYGLFVTYSPGAIMVPGASIPEGVPYSPHVGGTPRPAPVASVRRGERVFKEGEHVFEGAHVERRRQDGEQSDKVLDYNEGKNAPAPTAKPAPNR